MNLESAITTLRQYECAGSRSRIDARVQLLVTVGFIVAVVSMPLSDPVGLVWFFAFPIVMAEALGIGYRRVLADSLWTLPFIVVIGIFNPLLDRVPAMEVFGVTVSHGWLTFASVTLRCLLSVQALLVLVGSCGFTGMCRAFASFGLPQVLVTQLLMLYRFISVLLEEALAMHRARQARGFGRRSYPLRDWGTFAGQLLMRSLDRAARVNRAMIARGFTGTIPAAPQSNRLHAADWCYLLLWGAVIVALRAFDITGLVSTFINNRI